LLRELKAENLEKGAMHPELGRKQTLAEMIERIGQHGGNHLAQIEELKKGAGRGPSVA
jgi:hypothetical protein